jgi:Family of unknown function (DUF5343)
MPVPSAYLMTARNTRAIAEAIQRAGVPSRFTYEFLKQLGYPSSGDRPIIAVLKALGFLTDSGEPTDRYRRFKDPAQAKAVMAEAIRAAYVDVFTIDQQANTKTATDLKGIFARLSDKSESVNEKMAMTFKTLSDLADFNAPISADSAPGPSTTPPPAPPNPLPPQPLGTEPGISLHHDVHIHLPESTNIEVYDAIFRSLREHMS